MKTVKRKSMRRRSKNKRKATRKIKRSQHKRSQRKSIRQKFRLTKGGVSDDFFGESLGNEEYNDEWLEAAKNKWIEGAESREQNKELQRENRKKQKECTEKCFKKNGCDSKMLFLLGKNKKELIKNNCFQYCSKECGGDPYTQAIEAMLARRELEKGLGEDIGEEDFDFNSASPTRSDSHSRSASPTRSASAPKSPSMPDKGHVKALMKKFEPNL
jgi:hypothetical protein